MIIKSGKLFKNLKFSTFFGAFSLKKPLVLPVVGKKL